MTTNDHDPFQGVKPEPEAAKPTSVPTVLVGIRALVLEVADLLLQPKAPSPPQRARLLALLAVVRADGAPNKWREAVAIDLRAANAQQMLELDDGKS